ncbi:MAG: AsmA family protein, partial [Acidisphaera sp.]|nr:AsmA family protein [Acidisphaera sp.]
MRVLRALLFGLAALLALVAAAAWLAPGLLDWNRYRANIATLASAELGRTVRIDGPVTLTLLPEPVLTASRVAVADAGDGVTITAAALRLRVGLGPLLRGRIDARELVLRGADLHLPWPIAPGIFVRRPDWLAQLSARIENGQLEVAGVTLTGIDATLSAGEEGGYAAAGTARFSGRPWRFSARLSEVGADGAAGLDLAIDGQGPTQGTGASFTGQLAPDGTLAGRVAGRGPDLSQLLPAPAVPFRAEGRLTLASGLAAADDLALEIGGSPARGAVALRLTPAPRLDLALASSRLDLDAWLPVLLRGGVFALPVGLDLSAEAAQLGGGTLRRLRAAFDLADYAATLREATAILPGEANVRLSGRITRDAAQQPHFEGQGALTAPDFRTTLHWLAAAGLQPLEALPERVLRSIDIAATVLAEPGRLALSGISGECDGDQLTGVLSLAVAPRLAVAASLQLDRLELQPWLPASLPRLREVPHMLAGFDADLQLDVQKARWGAVAIDGLGLDAVAAGGGLTVRRLTGAVQGVQASLAGSIGGDGAISDGKLAASATSEAAVAGLLPPRLQDFPAFWHGPARLQIEAAGSPAALGLRIGLDFADARLEAQPTINLPGRSWSGPLTLRHPGAPRLLEALGLRGAPSWIGDGSLALVAQLVGSPGRLAADSFDLRAGALHAGGQLTLERTEGGPRLGGRISAETLPLPDPNIRSPEPLPLPALRGWEASVRVEAGHVLAGLAPVLEQAAATVVLSDGTLRLDGLTGRLGGGRLAGTLVLEAAAEPPRLALQASLAGASVSGPSLDLPFDIVAGVLDGSLDLLATGHSPAALLATLGGRVRLAARSGALSGFDLSRLRQSLGEHAPDAAL